MCLSALSELAGAGEGGVGPVAVRALMEVDRRVAFSGLVADRTVGADLGPAASVGGMPPCATAEAYWGSGGGLVVADAVVVVVENDSIAL